MTNNEMQIVRAAKSSCWTEGYGSPCGLCDNCKWYSAYIEKWDLRTLDLEKIRAESVKPRLGICRDEFCPARPHESTNHCVSWTPTR